VGTVSERVVEFSGSSWTLKRAAAAPVGPGPNYFDDSPAAVRVTADDALALTIARRAGRWRCAEVIGSRPLGYGRYEWTIDTPGHRLDSNVVLGLFTWSDDPVQHNRELDIEVSAWGALPPRPVGGLCTVHPADGPGHQASFVPPTAGPWTCSLDWCPARVTFTVDGAIVNEVDGPAVPDPETAAPRINLWLVDGRVPAGNGDRRVLIRAFRHVRSG